MQAVNNPKSSRKVYFGPVNSGRVYALHKRPSSDAGTAHAATPKPVPDLPAASYDPRDTEKIVKAISRVVANAVLRCGEFATVQVGCMLPAPRGTIRVHLMGVVGWHGPIADEVKRVFGPTANILRTDDGRLCVSVPRVVPHRGAARCSTPVRRESSPRHPREESRGVSRSRSVSVRPGPTGQRGWAKPWVPVLCVAALVAVAALVVLAGSDALEGMEGMDDVTVE